MPVESAKKLIDEMASTSFKAQHTLKKIELGENGDAFLNNGFVDILRYLRTHLAGVKREIYTNFQNFTRDKAEIILSEQLIDSFHVNIDGSNEANYFAVKGLHFEDTMKNLADFLEVRKQLKSSVPLTVHVLTLNRFVSLIKENLGFLPIKLKDPEWANVPDDFPAVKTQLEKILDMRTDTIVKSMVFGWSEREQVDPHTVKYEYCCCPVLNRVETQAFIAPDGTWYACCYDSNNELVLGNVLTESIDAVFRSSKRAELIRMLKEKQFARIGGPCKTVNCCQSFGVSETWKRKGSLTRRIIRKLKKISDF